MDKMSFSFSNSTLGISVLAPNGGNVIFDITRSILDSNDSTKDVPFRLIRWAAIKV